MAIFMHPAADAWIYVHEDKAVAGGKEIIGYMKDAGT